MYLSPAPLYHTAPSVWSMSVQAGGITTVVMEKFDPEGALDAIQRHRVTHGQFVPAMFVRMLKLPEAVRDSYDLSSLKRVMHAAAPCPVEIKKQMIDWWGPIIDEYYASSEAIGSTLITAEDWLAHPGSVGKPMLGGVHILDEDGNELPPGQAGEIYFEGGYSFEYLNDPTKTAASRDKHGWVTVGDVGYLDDEGYLYLTDRRHHMIISGGVNIYPQEAENLLVTHPKVLDAAVFGVPDDEMGQRVDGGRADRRPGRRHRRVRRRAAGLAARPVVALQVSAVDRVRGAAAAHRHREALQERADREVFGVTRAPGGRPVGAPDTDVDAASAAAARRDRRRLGRRLSPRSESWLEAATFTLTEDPCADRRVVTVDSVPETLAELTAALSNAGRTPARCATTCCARSTPAVRRWPGW